MLHPDHREEVASGISHVRISSHSHTASQVFMLAVVLLDEIMWVGPLR